jgi:fibronectin-binding autotransporter adhesin
MRFVTFSVALLAILVPTATAQTTFTWSGAGVGSDGWNAGANWVGNLKPPSTGDTTLIFTGSTRLTPIQDIASSFRLNSLVFDANAGAFSLSGNALDFRTSSASVAPTIVISAATDIAVNNNLTLTNAVTVQGTSTNALTLGGAISGSGALTMQATGTLIVSGNNSYSGGTNLNSGTLRLMNASALGTTGTITFNGGTLQFSSGITTDYSARFGTSANQVFNIDTNGQSVTFAGALTSTAGNLFKFGAGTLTLTGANAFTGSTNINSGTLQVGNGGTTGTLGVSDVSNNAALVFNRSNDLTVANTIFGSGTVTKLGAGTLTLTATNSYAGVTTISAGVLQIGDGGTAGTLGSNGVTNNGTLTFNRSDDVSVGNIISGSGGLTQAGGGTLTLTATNTYSGVTTISSGVLQVGNGGTAGTLGTGGVTNNASLVYNRSDAVTVSNAISGVGGLTQNGAGSLTLTGANTYTGDTLVNAGTVQLGVGGSLTNTQVIVGPGATFNIAGGSLLTTGFFIQAGGTTPAVVNLTSGSLTTGETDVGDTGANSFIQTGGIHSVANTLILGIDVGTNGSYSLSGSGQLSTSTTIIGGLGHGDFAQTGGVHTVANIMTLGGATGGSGNYTLGGTGQLSVNALVLGGTAGATGNFTLGGTGQLSAVGLFVGFVGNGTFTQTAGTTTVTGSVAIGDFFGSTGAYMMSGGTFTANSVFIGNSGAGTVTQTGGTVSITNQLSVASTNGLSSYTLSGGALNLGRFVQSAGTGAFNFNGGTLQAFTDTTNFMAGLTRANVQTGGAVIDTSGHAITIAQPLLHDATLGLGFDGGLAKIGVGTLVLTGNNTYNGPTTISAGVLQVGSGGTAGTLGAGPVTNNAGLVFNRTDAVTIAAPITGSGSVTQAGAGTLTLIGADAYTGATAVTRGTLSVVGPGAITATSGVSVGAGATLAISNGGRVNVSPNIFFLDGAVANPGQVTLAGTNSALAVPSMFVGFNGTASFSQSGGTNTVAGSVDIGVNTGVSGSYTLSAGTLTTQGTIVGDLGVGTFTQTNGTHTVANQLEIGRQFNSSGTYALNGGTLIAGSVVGLHGMFLFNGGILQPSQDSVLTNVFMGGLAAAYVQAGGAGIDTAGHSITISQPILVDPLLTTTPAVGLAKFSAGTLTFTGNNTYTGPTYVVGGTLQIGNGGTTGSLGNGDTVDATSLVFNRSDSITYSGSISGAGSVTKLGAGTLTLSGTNTFTGGLTIAAGTVNVTSDANLGDPAGAVTLQNGGRLTFAGSAITTARTWNLNSATLAAPAGMTLTLNGATVNGGFLNSSGAGAFAIGAGGATIHNATVFAGTTINQAAGPLTADNLTFGGSHTLAAGQTFTGSNLNYTASAQVTVNGAANVQNLTSFGRITVNSGGTLTQTNPTTLAPLTLGGGSVTTVNSGGTLSLGGSGATQLGRLAGGLLINNGTVTGGRLVVDFGGVAKGTGSYSVNPLTINGGQFSPGSSPGRGNVEAFIADPGSSYTFEINDGTPGGAGPTATSNIRGWDLTTVRDNTNPANSAFFADATMSQKFTINLVSLTAPSPPDVSGMMDNFNQNVSTQWLAFSVDPAATTPFPDGFDPNTFTVNTSGFKNTFTGSFALTRTGNDVFITYTPVPEPGLVLTIAAGGFAFTRLARRHGRGAALQRT